MADAEDDRPILSKELKVDEELVLSRADFKKTLADSVKSINTQEDKLARLNGLLHKPIPFPSNYVLATLSHRVYELEKQCRHTKGQDVEHSDSDTGEWRLLTAGYDPCSPGINGYCGAAYWNPDTQQVIVAHCGSKNLGAYYTDYFGVFKNEHVPQIDSAVTFTDRIVSVLKEINQEKGSNIQLFFTGHSLGAWLACITAFSAKFLQRNKDGCFISNSLSEDGGYHSSTVIFDGPGCKEMLERIQNSLMDRYGPSFIASLDITNYLSAPHCINACNHQVGNVYRLFIDLSEHKTQLERLRNNTNHLKRSIQKLVYIINYTRTMHKIKNIVAFFKSDTGDENGRLRIQRVKDWPQLVTQAENETVRKKLKQGGMKMLEIAAKFAVEVIGLMECANVVEGMIRRSTYKLIKGIHKMYKKGESYRALIHELESFLRTANENNDYTPEEVSTSEATARNVRYKTVPLNSNYKNAHKQTVFQNHELKFLEQYKALEKYKYPLHLKVNLAKVFNCFKDEKLQSSTTELLKFLEIEDEVIKSTNVQENIVFIKNMLHLFPEIQEKVAEDYKDFHRSTRKANGNFLFALRNSLRRKFSKIF